MNIEFLSTVAVIAPDPLASRRLYVESLGLPLDGYEVLHLPRQEPWGQTVAGLQSPEGAIVGISDTRKRLLRVVARKRKGKKIAAPKRDRPPKQPASLMDALERSLADLQNRDG